MSAWFERALPWLLALPALVLAGPWSPLARDPYPHLAGSGLALVFLLPLALALLWRGASTRGAWPFLVALVWALLARATADVTDTLEARRALLVLCALPLAFAGGAALSARGRASFQRLLVALTLLATLWALVQGFAGESFAGVLGDTGSLSQLALPGAAVAAVWFARAHGAGRALGALALLAFLVHVAAAPVLAGSHTLLAALLLGAWRGPVPARATLLALALCALLAPFVGLATREALQAPVPALEGAQAGPAHSLSGLGVRAAVWSRAVVLAGAHPLSGAGPGQFQAAFPPYRDAREIERSRHGVCAKLDTEVEHAHNDWLQGFCELGLPGGLALALGLLVAARAALAALADAERLPLGVAALGLLVNAFVHAPLSANPAASALALATLGSLTPQGCSSRRRAAALALPLLVAAPFAPALITHGGALVGYVDAARGIDALARSDPADEEARAKIFGLAANARACVLVALAAVPDSAPARELFARGEPPESALAAWERVLELRPHSATAWEASAAACVRVGRFEEARQRYGRALALSPTHPRLLENLTRLEWTRGDAARGAELLAEVTAQGCLDAAWRDALGLELVLDSGLPARGARVLLDVELAALVPEELHARARDGAAAAEALECLAQLRWARDNAAAGAFEVAVRNYRQAAERSRARRGAELGAAPLYALELAAAEYSAGRADEARTRVRGLALDATLRSELAPWSRAALRALGLE
jgi:Flp pilus assembly protein TadD/O-antigen ligase